MSLEIVPITIQDAKLMVAKMHRHSRPPVSALFALAVAEEDRVVGCAIVGRPVARLLQDGWTVEVTRLVTDGTKNAASKLYAAAWRVARELGWRRMVTYTLESEPGTSLRAAGWKIVATVRAKVWHTPSRPRVVLDEPQAKFRWEAA